MNCLKIFKSCISPRLFFIGNRSVIGFSENRFLSRMSNEKSTYPQAYQPHNELYKSISPFLLKSIEKRLSQLKQEIDLGLGSVGQESVDILEECLIKAETLENVKELIKNNYRNFSPHHLGECWQTIGNIINFSDDSNSCFELLGSKEFFLLANRTTKLARHMEPNEALETLFVLHSLGISMDTLLAHSLLQMVRFSMNEYSINELHKIVKLLRKIQKDQNIIVSAITLALPYAVRNRINYKEMNFYSISTLLQCIDMIAFSGYDCFDDSDALLKCLRFLLKNMNRLNLRNSINLLANVYSINAVDEESSSACRAIASKCIDHILNCEKIELDQLPSSIFLNVFAKIKRNNNFYDRRLFRFISKYSLSNHGSSFSTENLYFISRLNWRFKFFDRNLLSHFSKLMEDKDPVVFDGKSKISPVVLLKHLTLAPLDENINCNFPLIYQNILTSRSFEIETAKSRLVYFDFVKYCLMLDIDLEEDILGEWFSRYFKSALEESSSASKRHIFLETITRIYQGLEIQNKLNDQFRYWLIPIVAEYTALLQNGVMEQMDPKLDEIQKIVAKQKIVESNSLLIKSHVTPSGFLIDLLACLHDKTSIAFVLLRSDNFCREPPVVDRDCEFKLQTLQKSAGIRGVITINSNNWSRWSDAEKELFIRNETNRFVNPK